MLFVEVRFICYFIVLSLAGIPCAFFCILFNVYSIILCYALHILYFRYCVERCFLCLVSILVYWLVFDLGFCYVSWLLVCYSVSVVTWFWVCKQSSNCLTRVVWGRILFKIKLIIGVFANFVLWFMVLRLVWYVTCCL